MNRLEKLKKEKWLLFSEGLKHFENASFESVYGNGWNAASAEYEKIIAELEKDLKAIISAHKSGCVQYKDCDCWWQYAEQALQKLKEFKND